MKDNGMLRAFRLPRGLSACTLGFSSRLALFLVFMTVAAFTVGGQFAIAQSATDLPASSSPSTEGGRPASVAGQREGVGTSTIAGVSNVAPRASDPLYPAKLVNRAAQLSVEIKRLQKAVERVKGNDLDLEGQRKATKDLAVAARSIERDLGPSLVAVQSQIGKLGKQPKKGEPPETESVSRERGRLDRISAEIAGAIKTANLTQLRAEQLISRIHVLRTSNFTRNLFERRTSPVSIALWRDVVAAGPRIWAQYTTIAQNWWSVASSRLGSLMLVLVCSLFAYFALRYGRRHILQRKLTDPQGPLVSFFLRAGAAVGLVPLIALPMLVAASMFYVGFDLFGLMNEQVRALMGAGWLALIVWRLVTALLHAILLPNFHSWRLVGIPDEASRRLLQSTGYIAAVFAADLFLDTVVRSYHLPFVIGVAETFFANVILAGLLLQIVRVPMPAKVERRSGRLIKSVLYWLRLPTLLISLLIIGSTLFGYYALGRFIASQVIVTGCGGIALLVCHLAIRAFAEDPAWIAKPMKGLLDDKLSLGEEMTRRVASALAIVLNALLLAVAGGLLLISWGVSKSELLAASKSAFFGFEIGQFRISLFRILVAIVLFVGLLFLTRLLQRWLSSSVLTPKRVDAGIANSVQQGIGYAGMALAALVAISHVGLDITNLAIVAGALSVGIGFGLQSIVNNFVSGLILLVERPVKVGDWIVVGGNQGYVRKISVRATEIETFDRASVIVPNSEFITGTVQNWTHRNALGRVVVKIGASYNADPNHVREVLIRVAKECDLLLKYPAPAAIFEDFGASSLDFSLRCYISDVTKSLSTRSMLRLAIFDAFKAEGIEIPFPQHDIHLRDLDGLKAMVARAAEQKMREAATAGSHGKEESGSDAKSKSTIVDVQKNALRDGPENLSTGDSATDSGGE